MPGGPLPPAPPSVGSADDALGVMSEPLQGRDGDLLVSSDPLDRICPYLRSADGAWRSAQPDEQHRCTSQQPPAPLPLLAQERFCLTPSHLRCEWFKLAEASRAQALERDGVPSAHVRDARFRPAVRSIPVALAPATRRPEQGARGRGPGRTMRAALALAALAVVGVGAVLLAGSGNPPGTPLAAATGSPSPGTTSLAATAAPLASLASPLPATPSPAPTASPDPTPLFVLYEVQPGERMLKIAETFGIRKSQIVAANELGDPPRVSPGDVIVLPLPPGSTPPPGTSPVPAAP
jgi:LysM repeat protein